MPLTPSQLAAIHTDADECLVLAGAGSGKTRVLVERIVHLLKHGATPAELLVLTFTRKAAGEMRQRLIAMLGGDDATETIVRDIQISTFHAFALRVLQLYGDLLGYEPYPPKNTGNAEAGMILRADVHRLTLSDKSCDLVFCSPPYEAARTYGIAFNLRGQAWVDWAVASLTVIDPDDSDMLLKQVATDLGLFRSGKWKHGLCEKKVQRWREDRYCGRESEFGDQEEEARCNSLITEYQTRLHLWNLCDYGQLLLQCRRLFREHPDVLAKYHARFRWVLVDESQDTDAVQFDLHDFFAPPAALFMVGDFRQSIYGFRGARPDLILERHPDATVIDLAECFRCGDKIIRAANDLIANNGQQIAKPLIGSTGRAGAVALMTGRSLDIVRVIQTEHARGYEWKDIAVLARTHRTLQRLEMLAREQRVPCYRVGSNFDVCETDSFKNSLAMLRLIVNPRDERSLLRLAMTHGVDQSRLTLWKTVSHTEPCPIGLVAARTAKAFGFLRTADAEHDIVATAQELAAELPAPNVWRFWQDNCGDMTVAQAVAWYGLFNRKRDAQEDLPAANCVALLTVHAAKGLEWPCVFVVGLNEGDFPSSQSIKEPGGIEEERRIAYVAATRAKERLIVHYRRVADQSEEGRIKEPSRFLAEMGLMEAAEVTA